eukprot:754086-Hanusia_phi.AAC.2
MKKLAQTTLFFFLVVCCDSFHILGPARHCLLQGKSFHRSRHVHLRTPCKKEIYKRSSSDVHTTTNSWTSVSLSTQDESQHAPKANSFSSGLDGILKLPFIKAVMNFAKWLVFALRSILLVRLTWLLHATAKFKKMLLDPRYRMGDVGHQEQDTNSLSEHGDVAGNKQIDYTPINSGRQQLSFWAESPDTSVHQAFESFWKKMDDMEKLNIESEFRQMKEKNAEVRAKQDEMLASISGVHLSVLDFVEHGGLPPSVESLTAWLEIREIDTSLWGQGEAKTVQEFFHEIWAGECEPLTECAERVISVVKVRILDHDEAGTWQLYETKQKLCRDGRTRPRNRPLAEKRVRFVS